MVPAAWRLRRRYGELQISIHLIAGADDRVATTKRHSERFGREVGNTELRVIPGVGHMVHYFAQEQITEAVDSLARPQRDIGQRSA